MAEGKFRIPKGYRGIRSYGLAVGFILAALGPGLLMSRLGVHNVEAPLLLASVALAAWYGGARAAVVSLLLAIVAFDYFFVEPLYTFAIAPSEIPNFIVFAAFAGLVTWFSAVRHRAEEQLRQALERLQIEVAERTQQANLLDLTHDTIFVRDMNDVILFWNRGAQEMYGWTREEAIGKRADDLLHTVFPVPVEEIRAELLRNGRWDGELEKVRKDGARVIASSRWSLQRDERGNPKAILATNHDVTERKRREEQVQALNDELEKRSLALEATNKELEAFAYSVSHDLRAPLRHMSGFTELLQKNSAGALSEKGQRYIGIILESAKRMGNLIDDLLAFSRIGRAETHKTTVSLEQLVQEAVAEVREDSAGRDIVWKIGGLPSWHGDRSMLRLTFVNLIANAVKFTRTRPRAEIEIGCAERKQDQVVVFVRDNGVGFDMKYVNKLFGVFQRLHPSDKFEGTGIGLATVQRIVHRHGGRVWAEGAVDSGATFYFSLSTAREHER